MPIRRRTTLGAVLAGAAIVALTGCAASPGTTTASASSGPVTISFWHAMAGPSATELNTLVAEFNKEEHGRITVNASYQGAYADIQTKYTAAVQSQSTPDLLMMNDIATGFMIDSGQITPASQFTASDKSYSADEVPAPVRKYYGGSKGLEALPFSVSVPVLYLNKSLVEKAGLDPADPPKTLSDVAQWATKIHEATGAYGMTMNMTDSWILEELTASGGGTFCTPENGRGSEKASGIDMTSASQLRFLTTLQGLFRSGIALNTGTDSTAMTSAFASNKVGMMLTSSGSYTTADPTGKNSVVASFPTTSDSKNAGVVIGGNALWISGKGHSAAQQQAAYTFGRWLEGAENQAAWAKATGYLAMNTKSTSTATGKKSLSDPNVAAMYKELRDDPASTATAGCRTGAFPAVRATVIGAFNKIIEGADPASAMRAAESTAKTQIAAYNQAAG